MKYFLTIALLSCSTFTVSFAQNQSTQNCSNIDNRIVVNGSEIFAVKQCVLHRISDIQIFNEIVARTNITPIEISDAQYAARKIGTPYTNKDFALEFGALPEGVISDFCSTFDKQIVSSDNISFYYIEKCQKRKFLNYNDVMIFTNTNTAFGISAISDYALNQIQKGRGMLVQKIKWQPPKTDEQILATLPKENTVCARLKSNAPTPFVSYYASIFYFQNCVLYPIPNISVEIMKKADDDGGIYELSTQDILALAQGKTWNSKN